MKQALKNEIDILSLINKIQEQLILLDRKVDTLISRSVPQAKPSLVPPDKPHVDARPHDHNKGRVMHTAICADCKKECTIPFKPSGDRPVYCKDCFSRRKVINMSGIKAGHMSKEAAATQVPVLKETDTPKIKAKAKKVAAVKKPVAKKKPVPKKK